MPTFSPWVVRLAMGPEIANAARVIGEKARTIVIVQAHFILRFGPRNLSRCESVADFDAFDRVDADHRRGQVGIDLAVNRRAQTDGKAAGLDFDHRPDRRTRFSDFVEKCHNKPLVSDASHYFLRSENQLQQHNNYTPHLLLFLPFH